MTPRNRLLALALASAVAQGCGRDLGKDTADMASDTAVLKEAQDAVNAVVRAGGDCEAVQAVKANALRKLDEANPKIRTIAGRQTLDTLRKQAGAVIGSCE